VVAFPWHGPATHPEVVPAGPLALIPPALAQLAIEALIDRPGPPDPRPGYSHGRVRKALWAARLGQPTALAHVAGWAHRTGADISANLPADKLNDGRLGRALDARFEHRPSSLASATAAVLQQTRAPLQDPHADTTDLVLSGADQPSQPRPGPPAPGSFVGDAARPPAQTCPGYTADPQVLQAGPLAPVDAHGALPVRGHGPDGNRNGHPAVAPTLALAQHHLP